MSLIFILSEQIIEKKKKLKWKIRKFWQAGQCAALGPQASEIPSSWLNSWRTNTRVHSCTRLTNTWSRQANEHNTADPFAPMYYAFPSLSERQSKEKIDFKNASSASGRRNTSRDARQKKRVLCLSWLKQFLSDFLCGGYVFN